MVILQIFKRIQLFWFSFSLSAMCLFSIGVASGHLDRAELRQRVAQFGLEMVARNPDAFGLPIEAQLALSAQANPQAAPKKSSLAALQARQSNALQQSQFAATR